MQHKQRMMQQAIAIEKGEIKEKVEVLDEEVRSSIDEIVNKHMKNWKTYEYVLPKIDKSYWETDEKVTQCTKCSSEFDDINRRHHCRSCGKIFCDGCSPFVGLTAVDPVVNTIGGSDTGEQFRSCESCVRKHIRLIQTEKYKEEGKKEKIKQEAERRREEWEKNQTVKQEQQKSKWTNLT